MLNNFRDICLVPTPDFTRNSLGQISEATDKPILIEDAHSIAVRRAVRLDHAELSMDRPEDEENDEHMMSIPESLKISTSLLFQ
jgi:hypothetical protein